MIDFHAHILPRLDDGAKDETVTAEMLSRAFAHGVRTVVATPHYYGKKRSPERFLEMRNEQYQTIQPLIPKGMTVKLGAEIHFAEDNVVAYERLATLAIEGTKYVLLELPFHRPITEKLRKMVLDFAYETDYVPILAHIERYRSVRTNPKLLTEFVRAGCLLQVDADAFYQKETKSLVTTMLKKGLVHAIGTDMHNLESREPNYDKAIAEIEKAGLLEPFEEVQRRMQAILLDEDVYEPGVEDIKRFFCKYY